MFESRLVSSRSTFLANELSISFFVRSYKQQKFNLLREESEGFAKAITELNQNFSITKLTSEQLYDRLMALIGYFDIDPNRMLDLVIESFEYHLQYTQIYVDLLHLLHFDQTTLCQLIGFKFQQYQVKLFSDEGCVFARTWMILVTRWNSWFTLSISCTIGRE